MMNLHGLAVLLRKCRITALLLVLLGLSSIVLFGGHSDTVAYWPLDEGTGQAAADASGHALDGRLGSTSGSDVDDPTWVGGILGAAGLFFDGTVGTGDLVDVPDSPLLEPANVTLEAWIRLPASAPRGGYVAGKGTSACHVASYAIYASNTGGLPGLTFYISDGASFVEAPKTDEQVWDDQWHHVAGTFDGAVVRFYLDGSEVGWSGSMPSRPWPFVYSR